MRGPGTYTVRRPEQVNALSSSVRLEIAEALQVHGAASISEIARALGRAPDSLYYHIRILQKVGLLSKVATRPRGRTSEAIYDLPGRPLKIEYRLSNSRVRFGIVEMVSSLLRSTSRDFRRAAETLPADVDGPFRRIWGARLKGRVTRSQLRAINRHLNQIGKILTTPTERPSNAELIALTFVLLPLNRSKPRTRGLRSPARTPKERT